MPKYGRLKTTLARRTKTERKNERVGMQLEKVAPATVKRYSKSVSGFFSFLNLCGLVFPKSEYKLMSICADGFMIVGKKVRPLDM